MAGLGAQHRITCELCEARHITRRYYDGPDGWIADCVICHVPMVVLRNHDRVPGQQLREHLIAELGRVADLRFGQGAWRVDDQMRMIPDHWHAHARPSPRGATRT
jgi:hypothetical protein